MSATYVSESSLWLHTQWHGCVSLMPHLHISHAHTHQHMHTCTHTYMYTHKHTHVHTNTHTRTQAKDNGAVVEELEQNLQDAKNHYSTAQMVCNHGSMCIA